MLKPGRWGEEITTHRRGVGMYARRWMVVGVVLALQLLVGGLSSAMAGPATESIRGTVDEVLKILNDKELKTPTKHEDRKSVV